MSADDFKGLTKRFELTQEQAGVFFGASGRSGLRRSAHSPPPSVPMLLHVMNFLDMPPAEVESVLREQTEARRAKVGRRN